MKVLLKEKYLTDKFMLCLTYGAMTGQHYEVCSFRHNFDQLCQSDSSIRNVNQKLRNNQSIYSGSRRWKDKGDSLEAEPISLKLKCK